MFSFSFSNNIFVSFDVFFYTYVYCSWNVFEKYSLEFGDYEYEFHEISEYSAIPLRIFVTSLVHSSRSCHILTSVQTFLIDFFLRACLFRFVFFPPSYWIVCFFAFCVYVHKILYSTLGLCDKRQTVKSLRKKPQSRYWFITYFADSGARIIKLWWFKPFFTKCIRSVKR